MEKIVIILIIVGVVMLAGSNMAQSVAIDLSAGPHAEGEAQVLEAQAESIQAQNQTDQAAAAQELNDKAQVDEATRASRVFKWKALQWVLGIVGGFSLAFVLIMVAVNAASFMGLINFRMAVMPVGVQRGDDIMWVLPLMPNVGFLTHQGAPGVVTKLTAHEHPRLSESRDSVGLAMANALREKARSQSYGQGDGGFANAMHTLSDVLNGRPRLGS
ncbi:hypothetical protein KJZ67_02655 [Patescibacteria group bacterium]|nr:hypothetical protein [Patescibacteria group bacterium]